MLMTSRNYDSDRARREPEIVRLFQQARAEHPELSHTDLIKEVQSRLPRGASKSEVRRIADWFRLPTSLVG